MRITSKGQVTIPIEVREKAGLLPHTEVVFEFDGNAVRILPVESVQGEGRGQAVLRHLAGRATTKLSTDEILALTREP
ncbi:AbrB/MazE/SpoVT family DNA-binding domain-containing protein [Holophaga foetida]|uniref:AbrB/MazE/SpoVT family DNA-binding domain-containing protein n=1 Tax=Holophaga foetida TaxID=35839 RepID=UPI0002475054|nr:AbrB/MazE/SpoVT family DNA-binding domain-containing protein [Holophaga foetida]